MMERFSTKNHYQITKLSNHQINFGIEFEILQSTQSNHMKKLIVTLTLFFVFAGINTLFAQANFKFEKTTHDFGVIKAGKDTLWVDFKFVNDGSEPLLISDVKTSCDCTLAEWPKTAIQPGRSGIIKGGFKIEGKSDGFNKNIIIMANTMPGTTFLTMKGMIVPQ
jgi:hypothetical protein